IDFLDAEWLSPNPDLPAPRELRAVAALLNLSREELRAAAHDAWERLSREAMGSGFDFPEGKRGSRIVEKTMGGETDASGELISRASTLRTLSTFADLDDRSVLEIAEIAGERRLRKAERVFRAQDPAPDFFLVIEGRIELERVTPVGGQPLGEASTGEF